jgi:hypothetical protein
MGVKWVSTNVPVYIYFLRCFNATFRHISALSCQPVLMVEEAGVPTMGKQLIKFITCGCESSASFFVIYKAGRELTPYW